MTGRVIGVDPGPTPGIVVLHTARWAVVRHDVIQCSASALYDVLRALDPERSAVVAVEKFVARGRASTEQQAAAEQASALAHLYPTAALRPAVTVKPWATDARLAALGLIEATKGMRHARDAARHALYAGVYSGLLHDPLSAKAGA